LALVPLLEAVADAEDVAIADEVSVEAAVVLDPAAGDADDDELLLQPTAARLRPTARTSVRPVGVLKRAVMQSHFPCVLRG
jgi:hypothetical protein